MRDADKYFDKFTFTGLVLLLPATIILLSILLRAVHSETLYYALFVMKKTVNPYTIMNSASLLSLIICFADILKINSKKINDNREEIIFYNKSLLNVSVIFINISYIVMVYFYHEFEKLGNIPVGRN